MSVTLTVSSRAIDPKCAVIKRALINANVSSALITPSLTVFKPDASLPKVSSENACIVTLPRDEFEDRANLRHVVDSISAVAETQCAHLKIDGIFSGCVLNYLRPSACSWRVAGREPIESR